jgi:periplasmic divalent cation tolerance protein
MSEVLLVYTTWPDAGTAEAAARTLVGERLAACANILGPMRSVYRWEGAVETADEIPMLLKTSAAKSAALTDRIIALHPYETPCVVTVDVTGGNPAFLAWVLTETP